MRKSSRGDRVDNDKNNGGIQNGEKASVTYVFDKQEEAMFKELVPKIRTGVWQIFPSACASLTCVPFGMMLGWPSPTYPKLLAPDSPVPITLDQSAMIAGFLMIGISFGTIFSYKSIGTGPKYGIILGNILILIGWVIMWNALNIYFLLASRFILGAGYGYATGQIKCYITEMSEDALSVKLIKQLYFYGVSGFLLAYCVGPFVSFRLYSLVSLIISVFTVFLSIILPSTPRELLKAEKVQNAKKLLLFLKPDVDPDQEVFNILQKMSETPECHGFMKIMRSDTLRRYFIKLTLLLICQQYCGAPSTLVYTQIIFAKSMVPYPEYLALIYAVLFIFSSYIGTYISPKYNKKSVLLFSSCSVLVLYISKILVIYFKVNEQYFRYASVIIMYLYIIVYTVGLGSIPFSMINDWFPKSYRTFVIKYYIILFSILALTITKIFQVLMGKFPFYIPFCLFTGVIVFAILFISIFISTDTPDDVNNEKDVKNDKEKH